jgi:hypothetical protein
MLFNIFPGSQSIILNSYQSREFVKIFKSEIENLTQNLESKLCTIKVFILKEKIQNGQSSCHTEIQTLGSEKSQENFLSIK